MHPYGRPLARFRGVVLASVLTAAGSWLLPAQSTPAESSSMSPRTIAHNHAQNRRQNAMERYREQNLRQFESGEGVVTLTNRGAKYSKKKGYKEVEIDFEPIYIDPKWRKPSRSRTQRMIVPEELRDFIAEQGRRYNVDANLISAVIKVESNWNATAVSSAGASGLMQLMPGTASDMGVKDIFDPYENIAGGTQYLSKMLGMFNDNLDLALAAYNAGPGNVLKYGGIPPFRETQNYVVKVQSLLDGRTVTASRSVFSRKGAGSASGVQSRTARPESPSRPGPGQPLEGAHVYLVQFHSGLSQPADNIVDKDPYYYIEFGRRSYSVRKDLVKEIVKRS